MNGKKPNTPKSPPTVLIAGLDNIAASIGCGRKMVRRLIDEAAFPARRWPDGTYRVSPEAIRDWDAQYDPDCSDK